MKKMAFILLLPLMISCAKEQNSREKISINSGWKFMKYESEKVADTLSYDVRPEIKGKVEDDKDADAKPTQAVEATTTRQVLKPWIMPTGNEFLSSKSKSYVRPETNPGEGFPFVKETFDDSHWETVDLPHDWAIKGPFYKGWGVEVGGGMGRLPSHGVAWYRRKIDMTESDKDKSVFLDIDGAMSYAMVWINGKLAGGWPYGYTSFRIDLTPYLNFDGPNQLAIRLDNPNHSSRWYPGGGIYRNVWLVKTEKVHIAHWGTFMRTSNVSKQSADVSLEVTIENLSGADTQVEVKSSLFEWNDHDVKGKKVGEFSAERMSLSANGKNTVVSALSLQNPKLWGPPPTQTPHLYLAETNVMLDGKVIDTYTTRFGIRSLVLDADRGVLVNGAHIEIKGVNQHHDLGALGAAFNTSAAARQLKVLREMGCNAIRLAHNPSAPELLELTDKIGFLVVDELYDSWERKKTPHDFHLIFKDWHEQDLRALIRRDRNSPSVIMWSLGNEVGEQYTGEKGAKVAQTLREIANDEDPTRLTTASINYAKAHMEMPPEMEVISLNYQGEGIRNAPGYAHLKGINTPPAYPSFHERFPDKLIISSENAAALSSRGTYVFPVTPNICAPVSDSTGGDPKNKWVSAYELYTAPFGSSADKVLRSIAMHPYVAGGFIWSGWDYLGEPTPYYEGRSSYYGVIDLAGFKKDRFYLYQAAWRPDVPMVHILPHWNWPDRVGKVTPVHVFTSGDEVELFLNNQSLGRKKKGAYEYRLRWDDVTYEPGELKAVAYKNGEKWVEETVGTTGGPYALSLTVDRAVIRSDGKDLAFVTVAVVDQKGVTVPDAMHEISLTIEGAGEIVATDNGDPSDMIPFPSLKRNAFNGLLLGVVRSMSEGELVIKARSEGLQSGQVIVSSESKMNEKS